MKYTVLIAGGFKPPHKGHNDFIKFYLDNPEVEEVILFCGEKKRDSISIEATEAVFKGLRTIIPPQTNLQASKP